MMRGLDDGAARLLWWYGGYDIDYASVPGIGPTGEEASKYSENRPRHTEKSKKYVGDLRRAYS